MPVPRFLVLKSLLFTLIVPGTVAVYLPNRILNRIGDELAFPPLVLAVLAGILLLSGTLGYLSCAWDFVARGRGTPSPFNGPRILLSSGFYRRTRNPMFVSVLLILFSEALLFSSAELLAYAVCVALVLHLLVVFFEEPRLRQKFGSDYAEYCRRVSRWGLGGL